MKGEKRIYVRLKISAKHIFGWIFNSTLNTCLAGQHVSTWIAVHGGKMVLVVLVGGQFPGADRRVERVRVGDEVRVSQVGGQVVCGGEGRRVGGRVALWRLGGYHHPADPCGILQHLRRERGVSVRGIKTCF